MSQKGHRKYRKVLAAAAAATALAGVGSASHAALVTYNMYATGLNGGPFDGSEFPGTETVITSTNGGTVTGYKAIANLVANDEVTLDLFVTLQNNVETGRSTTRKDDGYWTTNGSFLSTAGGLLGNIRGDTPNTSPSTTSNTSGFNVASQSGFQHDIDSDGDLDVGSLAQNSADQGTEFPWFVAVSGTQPNFGPNGNTTANLVQWIGETTFTVTAGTGDTSVNYQLRIKTDGADDSAKRPNHFVINNNAYDMDGSGNGIIYQYAGSGITTNTTNAKAGSMGTNSASVSGLMAIGSPVILAGDAGAVPEPASLGLLGLGAAALLRRRPKKA
jgi:hypothetical protein